MLFTDETNKEHAPNAKFFIYGGVFFPAEKLAELHALVEKTRFNNSFQDGDSFKFDTRSRPNHVTREKYTAAKRDILNGCHQLGVRFIACLVLHEIAPNRSVQELVSWGANGVIAAFDHFLEEEGATGICTVDRLPFKQGYQYLEDKFQHGLTFPGGRSRRLERIHLFASTCQGASHANSAIDIILGAFRYCVNERSRTPATYAMFPVVASMMWHKRVGDTIYIRDYGLLLRPKQVKVPVYQQQYDELTSHLTELLKEAQ